MEENKESYQKMRFMLDTAIESIYNGDKHEQLTSHDLRRKRMLIDTITETILKLTGNGFTYDDELVSALHNERAFYIGEVEQKSPYIVKFRADGKQECFFIEREKWLSLTDEEQNKLCGENLYRFRFTVSKTYEHDFIATDYDDAAKKADEFSYSLWRTKEEPLGYEVSEIKCINRSDNE